MTRSVVAYGNTHVVVCALGLTMHIPNRVVSSQPLGTSWEPDPSCKPHAYRRHVYAHSA